MDTKVVFCYNEGKLSKKMGLDDERKIDESDAGAARRAREIQVKRMEGDVQPHVDETRALLDKARHEGDDALTTAEKLQTGRPTLREVYELAERYGLVDNPIGAIVYKSYKLDKIAEADRRKLFSQNLVPVFNGLGLDFEDSDKPSIRFLSLTCPMDKPLDETLELWDQTIEGLSNLRYIEVTHYGGLDREGAQIILKWAAGKNLQVRGLDVTIGDDGEDSEMLEEFDFSQIIRLSIHGKLPDALLDQMIEAGVLKSLKYHFIRGVTKDEADQLLQKISRFPLECLSLSDILGSPVLNDDFAKSLETNQNLTRLRIFNSGLTRAGIESLAKIPCVNYIDLSRNTAWLSLEEMRELSREQRERGRKLRFV